MILKISSYRGGVFSLDIADIKDIVPRRGLVVVKPYDKYMLHNQNGSWPMRYGIHLHIQSKKEFDLIVFEYISHIKKNKDPEDRVAWFEYQTEDGRSDFELQEKLIESRKTPKEKETELEELHWFYNEFKRFGIDTKYIKEEIRNKMLGA